jgi:hypothetical protein
MVKLNPLVSVEAARVTVVIFASSDDIAATIDSVLAQDYPNFHCLVVEDEGIIDFAQRIECYYIKAAGRLDAVLRQGVDFDSLNEATQQANGRYIAIVTTADVFRNNWLSVCVAGMEANPQAIVGYSDWVGTDEQGNVVRDEPAPEYDFRRMVLDPSFIPGPGALIRRSTVSMPRLRNRCFRLSNGYEAWLLLGLQGDFVRIPGTTAWRRNYAMGTSDSLGEYLQANRRFFKRADLPGVIQSWHHESCANALLFCKKRANNRWIAARLLVLDFFSRPRALSALAARALLSQARAFKGLVAHALLSRSSNVAHKKPLLAMWFLALAFPFSPRTTVRILLRALAKRSARLTQCRQ